MITPEYATRDYNPINLIGTNSRETSPTLSSGFIYRPNLAKRNQSTDDFMDARSNKS